MNSLLSHINQTFQRFSHQPPFSVVIQMDETECGLASLTMLANALGVRCEIEDLRHLYGSTRGGMTIGELCNFAHKFGLAGNPTRCNIDEIVTSPSIVFVKGQHFSVLWKISNSHYYVADPADGLLVFTRDTFQDYFSDIAITFTKSQPTKALNIGLSSDNDRLSLQSLFSSDTLVVKIIICLAVISTAFILLNAGAQDIFMTYIVEEGEIFWTKGLIVAIVFISIVLASSSLMLQIAIQRQLQYAVTSWNNNLFASLLRAPYSFFVNKSSGLIASRLTQVNEALSGYQSSLVMAFTGILNLVVYILVVLLVSPALALVSIVGIAGFIYVGIRFFGFNIQNNYQLRDSESTVASSEFKMIAGRNQILVEGVQTAVERDLADAYVAQGKAELDISRVSTFNEFWLGVVDQLLNALLLTCSSILIVKGHLTTGTYAAINVIIGTALEPIRSLSRLIETLQNSRITFDSAAELYQPEPHVEVPTQPISKDALPAVIEFENVSYSYSLFSQPIISDANLTIGSKSSSAVAIRLDGHSGSGKSTVLNLLMGLIKPSAGSIFIFGVDVSSLPITELRKHIQCVDRSPLIVNGSVESNAMLGAQCTREDYKEALVSLGLDQISLFRRQSRRYLLNETSVSIGQGVMINLVRAALIKPRLLLIDESLVSLPEHLHRPILKGFLSLNISVIIVQHGDSPLISSLPTLHMHQLNGSAVNG